jgi:hypothetical protein
MTVADLVELADMAGVKVMLKIDGERATHRWTVHLSGPHVGFPHRRDVNRLDQALAFARQKLAGLPGDWSWLDDEIEDLDAFVEHYDERGRRGEIVIVDSTGEQPVRIA